MAYWLMKSEPSVFGIEDLAAQPNATDHWDGVRNYQARNFMRDQMRLGDEVFFYHSNCREPGIVGIACIAREAYPDHTALDPDSPYFDPKSDPDNPRWFMVDIQLVRRLARTITLTEIKSHADALEGLPLIKKGNRLSVMPVDEAHWRYIVGLEASN